MTRPSDTETVKLLRAITPVLRRLWEISSSGGLREKVHKLHGDTMVFADAIEAAKPQPTLVLRAWGAVDSLGLGRTFPLDDYRGETIGEKSKAAQADARAQSAPSARFVPLYSQDGTEAETFEARVGRGVVALAQRVYNPRITEVEELPHDLRGEFAEQVTLVLHAAGVE